MKKKTLTAIKYLALALILSACGGDYKDPVAATADKQFGSQKLSVVSGSESLTIENASISGTGSVLFESSYGEFKSGGSYALDFTLQDGGSLTLVSHSDSALLNGWEMEFRRQGSGPGSLLVSITAQGITRDTKNSAGQDVFAGFNAALPLKFQTDVHNNETPSHSLTWSRLLGEDFSEAAAILNTEENDNSPGIGSGIRWGLKLKSATITRADRTAPKFEE